MSGAILEMDAQRVPFGGADDGRRHRPVVGPGLEQDAITHFDQPLFDRDLDLANDAGRLAINRWRNGQVIEIARAHGCRRRMEMTVEGGTGLLARRPVIDRSGVIRFASLGSRGLMVDAVTEDRAPEKDCPAEPDLLQQLAAGHTFGHEWAQTMPPTTMPRPRNNT